RPVLQEHYCQHLSTWPDITQRPHLHTLFFFSATPPTEIYTLSLHDALPILQRDRDAEFRAQGTVAEIRAAVRALQQQLQADIKQDRKSTRLNSSHVAISYAVFCLKKKKNNKRRIKHAPRVTLVPSSTLSSLT